VNPVFTSNANSLLSLGLTGAKAVEKASTPEPTASRIALLTARLTAGEEEAFREFHQLYFDRLYQFLLVVARGREDEAQEALQQTLLRVVRHVRTFESEDTFWCWLKAVARSTARDAGRKQQRYLALLQNFAMRWNSLAADQGCPEEDQLRDCLEESLDELDPEDRRLIEEKYIDGAKVKELSEEAGSTRKAIESRLLRLRRQLRERMLKKLHSK
jgi:RNA polymerase sigma-70 factor (ECF subfamily)